METPSHDELLYILSLGPLSIEGDCGFHTISVLEALCPFPSVSCLQILLFPLSLCPDNSLTLWIYDLHNPLSLPHTAVKVPQCQESLLFFPH